MTQEPVLHFFRHKPEGLEVSPWLASSLQALESSFFLIAFERYPHALLNCAVAIESVLQASNINAKDKDGLQELFKKAKRNSPAFVQFEATKDFETFRKKRNDFTHRGFSPSDDSVAEDLYLDIALPLLFLCFSEFQSFDIATSLDSNLARHITAARSVHSELKNSASSEFTFCLRSLGHYVRWEFKPLSPSTEKWDSLFDSDQIERVIEVKRKFESHFPNSWEFKCPVCECIGSAIAELHFDDEDELSLSRMGCANCGFAISETHKLLTQVLLDSQFKDAKAQIYKEHGIKK